MKKIRFPFPISRNDELRGGAGWNRIEKSLQELTRYILEQSEIINSVTPSDFGAVGDGITDDTAALQHMFDSAENKTILIDKQYLVTDTIKCPKIVNIVSNNPSAYIHASMNKPIIEFKYTSGVSEEDYRNNYIKNLKVIQGGTGHGVAFVGWGDKLSKLMIENCQFYTKYMDSTGYGLYCENSLAHSYIVNSIFRGNGIYLNCRDANLIEKCSVFGGGNGIVINPAAYGCLNNAVKDCTIVNVKGNAIQLIDAEQVTIQNNQIEYADDTVAQTATNKGLIVLYSSAENRRCEHVIIKGNNFGASTQIDAQLIISDAYDTLIEANRFVKLGNTKYNITVDATSKRTFIMGTNYRTTQVPPVTIDKLAISALSEVIGYRIQFSNSNVSMYVCKNDVGYVNIGFFNLTNSTEGESLIIKLPAWLANPSYQTLLNVINPSSSTVIARIDTQGNLRISVAANASLPTGLYYPQAQYYAGLSS